MGALASRSHHGAIASVGCQGKKRPYSVIFTSNLPPAGPAKEVDSVSKVGTL